MVRSAPHLILLTAVFSISACTINFSRVGIAKKEEVARSAISRFCRGENAYLSIHHRLATVDELAAESYLTPEEHRVIAGKPANGYQFHFRQQDLNFSIVAKPLRFEKDGRRSFYCDESEVVRNSWDPDVDANPTDTPVPDPSR